ncbi:MAG TPA: NAD(P)-dependent oxidoreductase, partial [Polyangiaceae bacterium]|nr:NAD(P)-dependent oxidoreductase [Polyangiaceae bacterium]
MNLPIVVTGSQGFVGKHLRRALDARGIPVLGVDRPGTGAELEQDLSDPDLDADALAERCGPVRGVIYMAATITRGSSVDASARRNLRAIASASAELFEAFQRSAPDAHFVYCSTYKGYGPAEVQPIDPQKPPQRPDPHSYGSAKALAERLLSISAARTGGRFAIVRPTCIYGPGQHLHNAIPIFLRSAWAGEPPVVFGSGRDVRDDVYAPDLARALLEACLRREVGAFHATGERARSIREVAELCCRAVAELGGPSGLEPRLDVSKPPKWWLDQTFDGERSRERLGYRPTPLLEGL